MQFKLDTTGCYYKEEQATVLGKLGFKFREYEEAFRPTMHMMLSTEVTVELNSLEELVEFTNTHGDCIVCGDSIEIYDNYRE